MRYPGGKGRSYQYLLNLMPPHQTYIETHLGGGAVMRHKRPAQRQIGIDIDPNIINKWRAFPSIPCELVCTDAVQFLTKNISDAETLIYADPPYIPNTRRRARVYRFDYSYKDHEELIECLLAQSCKVMVSGYANTMYSSLLRNWSQVTFDAKTHIGMREETVWLNYEPPSRLHDYHHLGHGFREREVVRRRQARLKTRISALPIEEQHGLLDWLQEALS